MKGKFNVTKEKGIIVSLAISFFCLIGLSFDYIITEGVLVPANSFITIILFVLLSFAVYWGIFHLNRRAIYSSVLPAFLFSVFVRVGAEFSITNTIILKDLKLYFSVFTLMIIFTLVISIVITKFEEFMDFIESVSIYKKIDNFFKLKHVFWIIFAVILICWIPAFLATYPGIYSYDAGPQVWQIFSGAGLDAHHPVIHTLLLDGSLMLGKILFGNYNVGLTIYVLIQAICMAGIFAYATNHIRKYTSCSWIQLFALLFFSLSPINQIWVMLTTKDTLFAGLFLICFLFIIDMMIDSKEFFKSKNKIIAFFFTIILMCLFRNQGKYVVVFSIPFCFYFLIGYRKKFLLLTIVPLIIVNILTGPVSDAFGIGKPNPREALSVPIQQIARVYNLNKTSINPNQMDTILKYLPDKNLENYIPWTSDPVKEGFNYKRFEEDKLSFFKVWIELLPENIGLYIDSFLFGSYGYFYMDETPFWISYILYDGAWLDDNLNVLGITDNSLFETYDNYLRSAANLSYEKIPIISVLLNEAFPVWVAVLLVGFIIYRKQYRLFAPLTLFVGFWGTILLGPLIAVRYAWPLIVLIPILFALLFINDDCNLEKC